MMLIITMVIKMIIIMGIMLIITMVIKLIIIMGIKLIIITVIKMIIRGVRSKHLQLKEMQEPGSEQRIQVDCI